ncbi:MAG: VPLPA-CTERM-specific exosortase XrtD [bacterium]
MKNKIALKVNFKVICLIKIGFQALLILGIYYYALAWLITHDWNRPDFSYCYLIPIVIIYLIWEKRARLAELPSISSWNGMIPLGLGLILFWLGELGGEYFTLYISFWLVLIGLCWIELGWRKTKIIAFPLCLGLSMFPPPNFLYNKISVTLKLLSSQLGVAMMQIYGLPVYREGNVIDLGIAQLQVVDACSGLRYLFPLIIMGLLLAYFFKDSLWKQIVLVLSTIPLSIVVNSIRIAITGILYTLWSPKVAEGFFHDFSGWFIFMLSLGILILEMKVLRKIREKPKAPAQKPHHLSVTSESFHPPKGSEHSIFVASIILLSATFVFSKSINFREKIPIMKSLSQFPLQMEEWSGSPQSMEQMIIESLDLTDYVIVDYHNPEGMIVNLYVAYYESQRKGESIHSPATCLPGSGWIFNESGVISMPTQGYYGGSMKVNRAFMQKLDQRQLSYYWFPQRGRILQNAYQLKIFTFWDALTKHRTDGALVRVITPVYKFEKIERAEARLQGFIQKILPLMAGYIPGKDLP